MYFSEEVVSESRERRRRTVSLKRSNGSEQNKDTRDKTLLGGEDMAKPEWEMPSIL